MKDQAKIIAALLVGAAAGAALGLLLAPDSGEGMRNSISDQFNGLVGRAKDKTDELREYGNNAVDRAKSKFRSGVNDLNNYRDNAADMIDNAKDHIDNAKARVKNTADNVSDAVQHG